MQRIALAVAAASEGREVTFKVRNDFGADPQVVWFAPAPGEQFTRPNTIASGTRKQMAELLPIVQAEFTRQCAARGAAVA